MTIKGFTGYDFRTPAMVRLWELHELERIALLYGEPTADLLRPGFKAAGDKLIDIWARKKEDK